MSGAFGSIFGGKKEQQSVQDTTPAEFQGLRPDVKRVFERLLSQGKSSDVLAGIPQSQASQTGYAAPITAAEQQGLADLAAMTGPGTARSALIDQTLSGKFTDPASNPFLAAYTQAAQRETKQALEDTLARALPGQFTAAGHSVQPGGSSPFDMAAARAYEAGANSLADIAAKIGYQAYDAERTRQQEAVAFSQQEVDTAIKGLQAQALPRLIEQHGIDQGLAEFQQRTQSLIQLLSLLMGGALNQTQAVGESKTSPNIFSSLFPGGLTSSGTVTS